MIMAALPYMLKRTAFESINSYAYSQWQYDVEISLRIESFFPKEGPAEGRMLLASVAESNFTVEGYTGAITSIASTGFSMVERKLFSLPKLALIPGMLAS